MIYVSNYGFRMQLRVNSSASISLFGCLLISNKNSLSYKGTRGKGITIVFRAVVLIDLNI
jgi:hypothetical protein